MEFLAWLEQTQLSLWLRESDWGHPIVLCFHAVGMGIVVGVSLMFSARVLGYSKDFPLACLRQAVRDRMVRICNECRVGRSVVCRRAAASAADSGFFHQDDPDRPRRAFGVGSHKDPARH